MIQAMPKDTLRQSSMLLDLQRLVLCQPFSDDVRPAERERQQRQQFLEPLGVGDVRLLKTEAASFQTPEQGLNFPPPGIVGDSSLTLTLRDDDQVFPTRQAHPTDIPALSPEQPRARERRRLIE